MLLVTGAAGELGLAVLHHAAQVGECAYATYRSTPIPRDAAAGIADTFQLDLTQRDAVLALESKLPRGTNIIHCAVSPQKFGGESADMHRATVDSAANLAELAARLGGRCVIVSTDLVFDGKRGGYTEADAPAPIMAYGVAKAAMEADLMQRVRGGQPIAIVRTSLILSLIPPNKHIVFLQEVIDGVRQADLFTDEIRNAVWSDDLASALVELAAPSCAFTGILHVAGAESTSRYEIARALAKSQQKGEERIRGALSAESGMNRPLDCSMDISLAKSVLKKTRLRGVQERLLGQQ